MFFHRAPAPDWAASGNCAGCCVPPSAGARLFVACGDGGSTTCAAGHFARRNGTLGRSGEAPGVWADHAIGEHCWSVRSVLGWPAGAAGHRGPRPGQTCTIVCWLLPSEEGLRPSATSVTGPLSLGHRRQAAELINFRLHLDAMALGLGAHAPRGEQRRLSGFGHRSEQTFRAARSGDPRLARHGPYWPSDLCRKQSPLENELHRMRSTFVWVRRP